eukprot:666852-Amphidinium_carterae.1
MRPFRIPRPSVADQNGASVPMSTQRSATNAIHRIRSEGLDSSCAASNSPSASGATARTTAAGQAP